MEGGREGEGGGREGEGGGGREGGREREEVSEGGREINFECRNSLQYF